MVVQQVEVQRQSKVRRNKQKPEKNEKKEVETAFTQSAIETPGLLSAMEQEAVLQQVIADWQHQDRPASMAELTEQDVASLYSVIQGHFLLGSDSATTAEEAVQPRGVGKKARPDQGCGACRAPRLSLIHI